MRLTVSEAAERLGVSFSTLKQWIYSGTIRTTRTAGGHHRIAESEIERLLAPVRIVPRAVSAAGPPRPPVIVSISGRNQLRGSSTKSG